MIKRFVASLVIVAWALMSVEAVAGELRDGDVHHESTAEALQHRLASGSDFGHKHAEEGGSGEQSERKDGDHQHGSSADHCTHVHGAALIMMAVYVTPVSTEHALSNPSTPSPYGLPAEVLPHPPKF